VLLVLMLIFSVINHWNKQKLIDRVLQSEEKRQSYIRMDTLLISSYKKIFWLFVASLLLMAAALYYFIPSLFNSLKYLMVEMVIFLIIMVDDYFYRKSFLKTIERKTEI